MDVVIAVAVAALIATAYAIAGRPWPVSLAQPASQIEQTNGVLATLPIGPASRPHV